MLTEEGAANSSGTSDQSTETTTRLSSEGNANATGVTKDHIVEEQIGKMSGYYYDDITIGVEHVSAEKSLRAEKTDRSTSGSSEEQRKSLCCRTLVLNHHVSPLHIYVFYLHSAVTITLFTFFNSLQSFALTQIYK